jgi:hypothetical protein
MLYWLALGEFGSTKMNGSAEALANSAFRLSPVEVEANSVNVSPRSPDRARVRNVPENVLLVVPQVALLQTATNESPAAPVCTLSSANPMPCVGSVPIEERFVAIRIGTISPGLPPIT